MTNSIVTAIQQEAQQLMGGYLITMAHEAVELAKERADRAQQSGEPESRVESNRTAQSWLEGFSSKVVEDKAEMALETIDNLPATAALATCRHLMKAAARQAFRSYRAYQRDMEQELREHQGDVERPEASNEPYPNQEPGFEYNGPSFPVIEYLTDSLHAHLSAYTLSGQQAMFGRKTSFNAHRFDDLPVGWVGSDGEAQPRAYYSLAEYITALEEAIAKSEESRVIELRDARKTGFDFAAFSA